MNSLAMQWTKHPMRDCCSNKRFRAETVNCGRQVAAFVVVNDVGDILCCGEKIATAVKFRRLQTQQRRLSFFDVETNSVPPFFVSVGSTFHAVDWKCDDVHDQFERCEHRVLNGDRQRNPLC